jgi:hypothetical protein
MTTGFLGRTADELELADEKDEFLRMPERLEANAAHPLLLPVLMYSVCSNTLRRQLRQVNWLSSKRLGARWGISQVRNNQAAADSQSKKDRLGYDTLHKYLAGEHARLMGK